ncbi:MAG: beta galactosidase jelly roll domain-containing protein [Bacteroidota bacterium]
MIRTLFLISLTLGGAATLWSAQAPSAERSSAQDRWVEWVNLRGKWRIALGDDPAWASVEHDDSQWETIKVPARWEDEGFYGYDGYAWYRRTFFVDAMAETVSLALHLGRIDDVDEVYVNGILIGQCGQATPTHKTAYHIFREYPVPAHVLRFGERNVVAVRVYDDHLEGGIVEGPRIGLYEDTWAPSMLLNLAGVWKAKQGDDGAWALPEIVDEAWTSLQVPMPWEGQQQWEGYDGYAWYRIRFPTPSVPKEDSLLFVMGKVDDLDETFLNGIRIGATGDIKEARVQGDEWQMTRAYAVPTSMLRPPDQGDNVIAVRVYDGLIDGGIFEGPVGLMTRPQYEDWLQFDSENPEVYWERRGQEEGFWEWLRFRLFGG